MTLSVIVFLLFIAGLIICVCMGWPVLIAIVAGDILFAGYALVSGHSLKQTADLLWSGLKKGAFVASVSALIGILTASWRASGTIAMLFRWGQDLIRPGWFLLSVFLTTSCLAYATGSCIGSVASLGVIFMLISRSGGVDQYMTAGALLSAGYFGDRGSPVSASANLVARLTDTDLSANVRNMLKTTWKPFLLCCLFYGALSRLYPLSGELSVSPQDISDHYTLSILCLVPAILVLIIPTLGGGIRSALCVSVITASILAIYLQGEKTSDLLKAMLAGYTPRFSGVFAQLISGGGLLSMKQPCFTLMLACAYDGIFQHTDLLEVPKRIAGKIAEKTDIYTATVVSSLFSSMIACTQALAVLVTDHLMRKPFVDAGMDNEHRALDLENTVIVMAALVPWNISASANTDAMGVGSRAILFAAYLYFVPLCGWMSYKLSNKASERDCTGRRTRRGL